MNGGSRQMLGRRTHIPPSALIVDAGTKVEAVAAHVRLDEHRVNILRGIDVYLRALEGLEEQCRLQAYRQLAAEQLLAERILSAYALVAEQTYLVVDHREAHSVVAAGKIEGHVGTYICDLRIVFKSGKVDVVGAHDVELCLLAHGGRIERRL